ncbi:MAG: Rsd/AlgQ family anti-sigma factor [Gammaproteobacteria bacterium]|nr:Rsd/AlgQ family anti-sigma factor [Gammaproteobacteria bacterium]MCP5199654.1 Rsd/AlgQ family anti-sigma factor [Gammaproteobacteria bacterium]
MSKQADPAQARAQTRKLIEDMLKERQQMLVLLWELSKLDLHTVDQPVLEMLDEFEDLLVDYIAAGHFGLYQRIAEGNERRQPVLEVAREIYPRIARSTDVAVEFSERYEAPEGERIQAHLANDLSRLGEELTTRIELEDQLILAMLGRDFSIPRTQTTA